MLDTCKQTIYSSNSQLYKQIGGVSMGSSLGPVLKNVMTKWKRLLWTLLLQMGLSLSTLNL